MFICIITQQQNCSESPGRIAPKNPPQPPLIRGEQRPVPLDEGGEESPRRIPPAPLDKGGAEAPERRRRGSQVHVGTRNVCDLAEARGGRIRPAAADIINLSLRALNTEFA